MIPHSVCVCGGGVVSLLPVVGTFILLMGCLMQNWHYSLFESYCYLLCYVQLTSLSGLLFSEAKWKKSGPGGEVRSGNHWEEWREGNSCWNVKYEKRLKVKI